MLVSEQRPARPLARADRVLFLDGRPHRRSTRRAREAIDWLAANRPLYLPHDADVRLLACRDVRFSYGERVVLDGVSLEVRRGEIVALTGPNGVGKTTLAKIAAGLLEPDAGEVAARAAPRILTQDPGRHLVTERVLDEVALGADDERARVALAQVGLAGFDDRHPRDLSVGRARAARARARCSPPSRTCSCSTSRRAASTPSARRSSRACFARRRRSAARSSSPTTCRGPPRSPTASSSCRARTEAHAV